MAARDADEADRAGEAIGTVEGELDSFDDSGGSSGCSRSEDELASKAGVFSTAACRLTAGTGGGRLRSGCAAGVAATASATLSFALALATSVCTSFAATLRAGNDGGRDVVRSFLASSEDAIDVGRGGNFGCGDDPDAAAAGSSDFTEPERGRLPTSERDEGLERDLEATRLRLGNAGGIVPFRCGSRGGKDGSVARSFMDVAAEPGTSGGMRRLPCAFALAERTFTKPSSISDPVVDPDPARGRNDGREFDRLTGEPLDALPLDVSRSIKLLDEATRFRPDCLVISSRISLRFSSLTTCAVAVKIA